MPELRLQVVDTDQVPVTCEFDSLNELMRDGYYRTIMKQALAYRIMLDRKIIGGCMIQFSLITDEDFSINQDDEYPACEIRYLVIDKKFRHQGIGRAVLELLIQEIRSWSDFLPIRFLVIEAFQNLREWYEQAGFKEYERVDKGSRYLNTVSMRLDFVDMAAVEAYAESRE